SHLWFTITRGAVSEVYWPTIDRPQLRDLQFLISDGTTFLHTETVDLESVVEPLAPHALGFRVTGSPPDGSYRLVKEVYTDPDAAALILRVTLEVEAEAEAGAAAAAGQDSQPVPDGGRELHLYVLCAPHLEVGGWGNSGEVVADDHGSVFLAHKESTWLALGASVDTTHASVGFVGVNDGWQDLHDNLRLDSAFDRAVDGNIAYVAEVRARPGEPFTVALTFSDHRTGALAVLRQSLGRDVLPVRDRFVQEWADVCTESPAMHAVSGDGGQLAHTSQSLLLAHEDKLYRGALIASLSIPWGEAHGDDDLGGYHLVWTRDMVNSATGLLAAGHSETALRALIYLSVTQRADGGFSQNFWIDGDPYWQGIQLDEVAFPILLARRLHRLDALEEFDPHPMVHAAAAFLIRNGPATGQERWEEASGYSPSTLAASIAALLCAAAFAAERDDRLTADFLTDYADFLEAHVEAWTVTTDGSLLPDVPRHYIRILPDALSDVSPDEDPNRGLLTLANRPPGAQARFPARDIVDPGFLELVRYGIRPAGSALMEDSLRVIDAVLKVDTPNGAAWHRYNHDGYGQRDDGGPYLGWGRGRAWPLLTGERGHYELAAGRSSSPYLAAIETFAHGAGLLPEQVWDEPDRPELGLYLGGPTGSAMPLMWAHAEYLKLLRSTADGAVFDLVPEVADRYGPQREPPRGLEIWKPNRRVASVRAGETLRIQAPAAFRLVWTDDEWATPENCDATMTSLGIAYVDIPIAASQRA
ncbi:MAG TPA: glycoside hydrolase family 15 protein, partial [Candidatus Limnocylindrales bacterium]|nr:glycoside hydrolase family 15 protein [Candidatus Limnocylindrales bacterium]